MTVLWWFKLFMVTTTKLLFLFLDGALGVGEDFVGD